MHSRKTTLKKQVSFVGKKCRHVSGPSDSFRLYEGIIKEELSDQYKCEMISQYKLDEKKKIIMFLNKNLVRIEK